MLGNRALRCLTPCSLSHCSSQMCSYSARCLHSANGQRGAFYRAMGLLTTASPCALVLVPLAYVSAIAAITSRCGFVGAIKRTETLGLPGLNASFCTAMRQPWVHSAMYMVHFGRRGMLIKGGKVLDALGSCRTVAFDKTGAMQSATRVVRRLELLALLLVVYKVLQWSGWVCDHHDMIMLHLEQVRSPQGRSHAQGWHALMTAQAAAALAPEMATARLATSQVSALDAA
jgi:hypothetical protein